MTKEREENKQKVYITNSFQTRTCQKRSQTPKEDIKYKQQNQPRNKTGKKRFNFKKGLNCINVDDYRRINNQRCITISLNHKHGTLSTETQRESTGS